MKRKDWMWGIASIICLAAAFVLCRYVFFDIHGMKQWPVALAIVGFAVLLVSCFLKKRAIMSMTVIGYIGGFALGVAFHSHGVDQGGGGTNNLWQIWTAAFLICIATGVIADIVIAQKAK